MFQAVLRVPEGDSVTATGSSKKIAKNIAAKLMLDKLDQKKADQANGQDQVRIELLTKFTESLFFSLMSQKQHQRKVEETTTTMPPPAAVERETEGLKLSPTSLLPQWDSSTGSSKGPRERCWDSCWVERSV